MHPRSQSLAGSTALEAGPDPASRRRARHRVPRPVPASNLAFWALMGFTFVLTVGPQAHVRALVPLRLAFLTATIAIGAHVVHRLSRNQTVFGPTTEMKLVLALLAVAVFIVPFSLWPGGTVAKLQGFIKTLVIFWLLGSVVDSMSRLRVVAWGLSLMVIPIAVSGIGQYLAGDFMASSDNRITGYAASPLATNPNDMALVLNLVLPLVIALFGITTSVSKRLLLVAMMGIMAAGVVASFSRAGFLGLLLICFLNLRALIRKRPVIAVVVGLIAVAGILAAPPEYGDRMGTIRGVDADPSGSSQARWGGMVAGMKFFMKNPLIGAGLGLDYLAVSEELLLFDEDDYRFGAHSNIHNVYIAYAVDLGLAGITLFLLLAWNCYKSTVRVRERTSREPRLRPLHYLAGGVQTSLAVFAVSAMFYPIAYHLLLYYFLGLAVALRTSYDAEIAANPVASAAPVRS